MTNYKPPTLGAVHTTTSGKVEMGPLQLKEMVIYWHRKGWEDHAASVRKDLEFPKIDPSLLPKEN